MAHATGGQKALNVQAADYTGNLLRSNSFNNGSTAQFLSSPASRLVEFSASDPAPINDSIVADGFGESGRAVKGDTVWFQVHTYFPTGFDYLSNQGDPVTGATGRLKFMRLLTNQSDGTLSGYVDVYIAHNIEGPNRFQCIYEGEQVWRDLGDASHLPAFDTWEAYQVGVVLDNVAPSMGGTGKLTFWKNGVFVAEQAMRTLPAADGYVDQAEFIPYWNGLPPKAQNMYVDDYCATNIKPQTTDAQGRNLIASRV